MILQIVDSAAIQHALQTGFQIGQALNQNKDFIQGVPNAILSSVITAITSLVIGFIHRRKTIKSWRKRGVLND